MTYTVIIAYPNNSEATFDSTYYLTSHMPLVESHWKNAGLLEWKLVEFGSRNDSEKPTFRRANIMIWEDRASFAAAEQGPIADKIFGDIPNFSNFQPTVLAENVIRSG
jgi:uncharacterized protein (TIGR02118 family)